MLLEEGARPSRAHLCALALITVLGGVLRLYRLDAQSVWFDEAFSVANSARTLQELFPILIADYVHPPLHYLVLHYWFAVAGFGAWEARLVSAILGTLAVPLIYLLARRFAGSAAGLCGAFLLATSQLAVYYSQEARPYAQALFFSLVAALSFLSFLERPDRPRSMRFALAGLALLYTHYYGAATLLALGIYWLIFRTRFSPAVFRRLAFVVLAIVIGFAPWLFAVRGGFTVGPKGDVPPPAPGTGPIRAATVVDALDRFHGAKFFSLDWPNRYRHTALGMVVFLVPIAAGLRLGPGRSPGLVLGLLLAGLPVAMAMAAASKGMIFHYRHYSFAVGGYLLAVAIGWRVGISSRTLRWGWLCAAGVMAAYSLKVVYTVPMRSDYRTAFAPLQRFYRPGDCVANRPSRAWKEPHYILSIYYRQYPLRFVPMEQLGNLPDECDRIWITSDKSDWMNTDARGVAADELHVAALRKTHASAERFEHRVLDLELFVRRAK